MKITARMSHEKVRHNQENSVQLVVSLTAPRKDWEADRPPVCLFPVIDISGSMGGDKLHYAKQSAMKLVDNLRPGDFAGLAVFTSSATLISSPREMTQAQKDELKVKIGGLQAQMSTNFCQGMLMGLQEVNQADLPTKMLYRVIMLTDGLANVDITGRALIPLLENNRGRATLSAFGYGRDADQELLGDLAVKGKGNFAFIENPDDAISAFAKELGGLLATYARNIKVAVKMSNGHKVTKVVSDVDAEGDEKEATIKLPDIISEEERHLVLDVQLSEQTKALPRATNVAEVEVSYDVINKDGSVEHLSDTCKAKVRFVKPGEEQDKPSEALAVLIGRAKLVQMQIEAEEKAKRGDYAGAQEVMTRGAIVLADVGASGAAAHAQDICSKMGSHSVYAANAGYLVSNKRGLTRGVGTSALCSDGERDLRAYHGLNPEVEAQAIMKAEFELQQAAGSKGAAHGEVQPPGVVALKSRGGTPDYSFSFEQKADPDDHIKVSPESHEPKPEKPSTITKSRSSRW